MAGEHGVSGAEPAPGPSVQVSEAAARQAEAARLDVRPPEGVVWLGQVELRGPPAALRTLAERLAQAARLAEGGP
jgi:hypothetical protein